MVGGGVAAFDCSGDGFPELAFAGGTAPASLWLNRSDRGGPLRFEKAESGIELEAVTGAYPLDVNGDGLQDLVLLRQGENVLMRGLGGCRFERANEAWGFEGGDAWHSAFAATWEAGEAWPTLAVGAYIDPREEFFPWGSCTDNWLVRPQGQGFAAPLPLAPSFCALSMLFTDWDRSGTPAAGVQRPRILQGRAGADVAGAARRDAAALRRGGGLAVPAHLGNGHRLARHQPRRLSRIRADEHGG
jgi:hypothetical protein